MKTLAGILCIFFSIAYTASGQSVQKEITNLLFAQDTTFTTHFTKKASFNTDTFRSKVFFDNIVFKQVEFNNILFNGQVSFNTSVFDSFARFSNLSFTDSNADIIFKWSRFGQGAYFSQSNFRGKTDFTKATFSDLVRFYEDTFSHDCDFNEAVFKRCDFLHGRFYGNAYFKSTFDSVYFNDIVFDSLACFNGASFNTSSFNDISFNGYADFSNTTFNAHTDFSGSRFYGKANFSCLNLGEKSRLLFIKTFLPDSIDFSNNPQLNSKIDLMFVDSTDILTAGKKECKTIPEKIAQFGSSMLKGIKEYFLIYDPESVHYINLFNTNISQVNIDYIKFRLYFQDTSSDVTKRRGISDEKKLAIYQSLLQNFQSRGLTQSYQNLNIEYNRFLGRNSILQWRSWLPDWWWRFGYEKERIFLHILIFLVLFTLITFTCLSYLNGKVYTLENIPVGIPPGKHPHGPQKKVTKRMRLWYSFVYTATVFFLFSLSVEKIHFNEKRGSFYLIFVYTIGIICIGYLANFILQK